MSPFTPIHGSCQSPEGRNTFEILDGSATSACQQRCWDSIRATADDPTIIDGRCVAYSVSRAPHEGGLCSMWDALSFPAAFGGAGADAADGHRDRRCASVDPSLVCGHSFLPPRAITPSLPPRGILPSYHPMADPSLVRGPRPCLPPSPPLPASLSALACLTLRPRLPPSPPLPASLSALACLPLRQPNLHHNAHSPVTRLLPRVQVRAGVVPTVQDGRFTAYRARVAGRVGASGLGAAAPAPPPERWADSVL